MKVRLVSIVIPTYNEEKTIAHVIRGVRKQLKDYKHEIIVVDKPGKDRTAQIAKSLGAKVIYDTVGKGSALVKGLRAARGSVLVSMDADLSNEVRELPLLIDGIAIGYDICMGSRFITGGGTEDMPFFRRFGNKVFVMLVNVFFGSNYSDMCYGYRSFRKGVVERLGLKEKGFGIETEINIKAAKKKLKVLEIPSNEKKRNAGEGKLRTFHDGWVILKAIFANLF